MKKLFLILTLTAVIGYVYASTRNIVPNDDNEGSLGRLGLWWQQVAAYFVYSSRYYVDDTDHSIYTSCSGLMFSDPIAGEKSLTDLVSGADSSKWDDDDPYLEPKESRGVRTKTDIEIVDSVTKIFILCSELAFSDSVTGTKKLSELGGAATSKWDDDVTHIEPSADRGVRSKSDFELVDSNTRIFVLCSELAFSDTVTGQKTLAELAAGGGGGATAINDLTDVDTTGIADGKVLKASSGAWVIGDDNNTTYTGGTNLTLAGTTFNVDDAFIINSGADTMAGALTINPGTLFMAEQADASADVAGFGQWWVNTATPNEPYFTDDAGNDRALIWSGGAFHDGFSDFVANEHLDWTSASVGTIHSTNYVDNNTTYTAGTGLTLTTTSFAVNASQSISTLSNLSTDGFVKTSGSAGTLSVDTNTYLTGIADQSVTMAKIENIASSRILGRVTAGAGSAEVLEASDVRTLLNVADGANAYSLPTAAAETLGGVKVGTRLSIADGTLSADVQTPSDVTLTAAPGNLAASGIKISYTAGEALAFGDLVRMGSVGKIYKTDADAASTSSILGMAIATISQDASGLVLLQGVAEKTAWAWTVGGLVYASTTAGEVTQTAPVGDDDAVAVAGVAVAADKIYVNPSLVTVVISAA